MLGAALAAAALALPATAAGQAPPPDERAAAQAFADAAVRFARAADADDSDPLEEALDATPGCRRALRRDPESTQAVALSILFAYGFRVVDDRMRPALAQFRSELANTPTSDPALMSGRGALTRGVLRKLDAAARRMRELGVSAEDVDAWEGDGAGAARHARRAAS